MDIQFSIESAKYLECLEFFSFVYITSQSSIVIPNSCIPSLLSISICDVNFYKVIIC